jgi:ATP-dependent DNA helicase RecG
MVSLTPPESTARLRKLFGADFDTLTANEIQALVTADLEGEVSNSRLQLIRMDHPAELTRMLQGLAARGFLDQIGQKRGTIYRLPAWASALAPQATALAPHAMALVSGASPLASEASALPSGASALTSGASALTSGASALAPPPSAENDPELLEVARPAREKPRLMPELTKIIIRKLCSGRYLTADQIGAIMDRNKDKLQRTYLTSMVSEGNLILRFPEQPTHPEQAYMTKAGLENGAQG